MNSISKIWKKSSGWTKAGVAISLLSIITGFMGFSNDDKQNWQSGVIETASDAFNIEAMEDFEGIQDEHVHLPTGILLLLACALHYRKIDVPELEERRL